MTANNTYWAHNGKFQVVADTLGDLTPTSGEATKGSLLDLFRLASNAYHDLYNNGLMNAEIRLPALIDALGDLKLKGYVSRASEATQVAIEEIIDFHNEYMDAEATAGYIGDDEEEEEEMESSYPDNDAMYEALELLVDYLCELCHNGQEVFNPMPAVAKAA